MTGTPRPRIRERAEVDRGSSARQRQHLGCLSFRCPRLGAGRDEPVRVPDTGYVSTYYRGRWFCIDEADFRSKLVFSFMIELLQLAQTTTAPSLPVITIPA